MDSQPRRTSTAFEYFLYAAIVAETGLAALIYKVILHSGELMHLRVYFAVFYLAFLAWTIAQLHLLHRARNSTPVPAPAADTRPVLGLTGAQLAIVVVVFATAVVTFSWALRLIN
jgi:hypothetical protein